MSKELTVLQVIERLYLRWGHRYTAMHIRRLVNEEKLIGKKKGRDYWVQADSVTKFRPGKRGPKPR